MLSASITVALCEFGLDLKALGLVLSIGSFSNMIDLALIYAISDNRIVVGVE